MGESARSADEVPLTSMLRATCLASSARLSVLVVGLLVRNVVIAGLADKPITSLTV